MNELIIQCYRQLQTTNIDAIYHANEYLDSICSDSSSICEFVNIYLNYSDLYIRKSALIGIVNCISRLQNIGNDAITYLAENYFCMLAINEDNDCCSSFLVEIGEFIIQKIGVNYWTGLKDYLFSDTVSQIYYRLLTQYLVSIDEFDKNLLKLIFNKIAIGLEEEQDYNIKLSAFCLLLTSYFIHNSIDFLLSFSPKIITFFKELFNDPDYNHFKNYLDAINICIENKIDVVETFCSTLEIIQNLSNIKLSYTHCIILKNYVNKRLQFIDLSIEEAEFTFNQFVQLSIKFFSHEIDESTKEINSFLPILKKIQFKKCLELSLNTINDLLSLDTPESICTAISILSSLVLRCGYFNGVLDIFVKCFEYQNPKVQLYSYSSFSDLSKIICDYTSSELDDICKITFNVLNSYLNMNSNIRDEYTIEIIHSLTNMLISNINISSLLSDLMVLLYQFLQNGSNKEIYYFLTILSITLCKAAQDDFIKYVDDICNFLVYFGITHIDESIRIISYYCISCLVSNYPNNMKKYIHIIIETIEKENEEEVFDNICYFIGCLASSYKEEVLPYISQKINFIFNQIKENGYYAFDALSSILITYKTKELIQLYYDSLTLIFEEHFNHSKIYQSLKKSLYILNELNETQIFTSIIKNIEKQIDESNKEIDSLEGCIEIVILVYYYEIIDPLYFMKLSYNIIDFILDSYDESKNSILDSCSEIIRTILLNESSDALIEISKQLAQKILPYLNSDIDYLKHFSYLFLSDFVKIPQIISEEDLEDSIYSLTSSIEQEISFIAKDAVCLLNSISKAYPNLILKHCERIVNLSYNRLKSTITSKNDEYLKDNLISLLVSIERQEQFIPTNAFISSIIRYLPILDDEFEFTNVYSYVYSVYESLEPSIQLLYPQFTIKFLSMRNFDYTEFISEPFLQTCISIIDNSFTEFDLNSILDNKESEINSFISNYKIIKSYF